MQSVDRDSAFDIQGAEDNESYRQFVGAASKAFTCISIRI